MTREEAIEQIKWYFEEDGGISAEDITKDAIDMAIEALNDRPHGEWIDRDYRQVDEGGYETANCSNCKAEITLQYPYDNFCPNCGALMGGEVE